MGVRQTRPGVLRIRSGFDGWWFFGAIFLAIGVGLWLYQPGLSCDRAAGECTLGAYDMPYSPQQTVLIDEIKEAEVRLRETGDDESSASLLLHVAGEPIALGGGWRFGVEGHRNAADRINAFLHEGEGDHLRLFHATVMLGVAAFAGFGLLAIGLLPVRYHTVLDRQANRYSIRRKRLLLPGRRDEGNLDQITGALRLARENNSLLGLLDGKARFLTVLEGGRRARRLKRTGEQICDFLGLGADHALDSEDFRLGLGETASFLRGVETHAREVEDLRARLQEEPGDVAGFRQLAIGLIRLERRAEARTVLQNAHRYHMERGDTATANRLAGVLAVLAP